MRFAISRDICACHSAARGWDIQGLRHCGIQQSCRRKEGNLHAVQHSEPLPAEQALSWLVDTAVSHAEGMLKAYFGFRAFWMG